MSSSKRRKLDGTSTPRVMSAVAARALRNKAQTNLPPNEIPNGNESTVLSGSLTPVNENVKRRKAVQDEEVPLDLDSVTTALIPVEDLDEEEPTISFDSRPESPELPVERPSIIFSTIKPSKDTIRELKDGTIISRLAPGERLVILGQYGISVQKGQVTILGSTLYPSKTIHRIFAPSSHALPVIRCIGTESIVAEIRLHQCQSGLESLKSLSPLFGKLWNENSGVLAEEYDSLLRTQSRSTFQILFSSIDGPQRYLQPLVSPPEWNEVISKIATSTSIKPPPIMVCGPKSSGKSTFAKVLGNRLLANSQPTKSKPRQDGVAILDLDPGQPEYSPPGSLSLVHIQTPNFGPPFSHPTPDPNSVIVRSHAIGAITPSLDPAFFMSCALDLFTHYRILLSKYPNCPLIINTPGWVLGTGLEILIDLISNICPSEILYMSLEGPLEVVESLRDAAKDIPLSTLPSQGSEYATRTAAHLRTMQTMSYFHLNQLSPPSPPKETQQQLSWNNIPLTSIPPWEVKYTGPNAGILGMTCYGEQPPANLLADTINGSLVSIVVIDDFAAIQNWDENRSSASTPKPTTPVILSTPESLPYFNPHTTLPLSPKHSHTLGLALIRGIDIKNHILQLLTPIPSSVIESEVNDANATSGEGKKKIMLVSGKLDTPGWAYIEPFIYAREAEKQTDKTSTTELHNSDSDPDENLNNEPTKSKSQSTPKPQAGELGRDFEKAPWIQTLHNSEGRGAGSRVWRVRRDLGRGGD